MKKPQHLAALACLLLQRRTTELLRSGRQYPLPLSPPEHTESDDTPGTAASLSVPNQQERV